MIEENENPLLNGLPKISDLSTLIEKLRYRPFNKTAVKKLNLIEKDELLLSTSKAFEPTSQALQAALTINGMIKGSYRSRNPLSPENMRSRHRMLSQSIHHSTNDTKISFGNISAFSIIGTTGLGKTTIVNRVMSMYPEALHHCSNKIAGYESFSQIIYLHVEMPGEGSRGGLIHTILTAIDGVLNKSYSTDYPKTYRTVDKLAVQTIILMHTFYTGLLIIDEMQLRNISESTQSKVMQLFILAIINSGIPVVLVGNPLGFEWINEFSQDVRRIFNSAPVILHPYLDPDVDDTWKEIYKGIRSHYVLDKYPPDEDRICRLLWLVSGGIPDFAQIFWKEAQRLRLLKPDNKQLTEEDIKEAYSLEGFENLRLMAAGFATKNPSLLSGFIDIPVRFYAERWGNLDEYFKQEEKDDESRIQNSQTERSRSSKRIVSERTKMASKQTKARNKNLARKATKKDLNDEDIRDQMDGLQSLLLKGF